MKFNNIIFNLCLINLLFIKCESKAITDYCNLKALKELVAPSNNDNFFKFIYLCVDAITQGRSTLSQTEVNSIRMDSVRIPQFELFKHDFNTIQDSKLKVNAYKCYNSTMNFLMQGFENFKIDDEIKMKIAGLCLIGGSPQRIPNYQLINYEILIRNRQYPKLFEVKYGLFILSFVVFVVTLVMLALIINIIRGCKRGVDMSDDNGPPIPPRLPLPRHYSMNENDSDLENNISLDLPPSYDQVLADMNKSSSSMSNQDLL